MAMQIKLVVVVVIIIIVVVIVSLPAFLPSATSSYLHPNKGGPSPWTPLLDPPLYHHT